MASVPSDELVQDRETPPREVRASREREARPLNMPAVVGITGAASHLGRHLVGLLEEDVAVERIVCLDVAKPETAGSKTTHCELDLADERSAPTLADALVRERVEAVLHLAFRSSPRADSILSHELESVGTFHLVNGCRRAGVRKIVMWSQTMLYGARPNNPNYISERHPLGARQRDLFFASKIDAEEEVLRFGRPGSGRLATILRTAPILGPTVTNVLTRYLSLRGIPTILGFDPLWQVLHEADAVAAFRLAVEADASGIFNIASRGVLPLSKMIKSAGARALPMPRVLVEAALSALWAARLSSAPPSFLDHLQYLCVTDTSLARKTLGFDPFYTITETVSEFASARRLRAARLVPTPAP